MQTNANANFTCSNIQVLATRRIHRTSQPSLCSLTLWVYYYYWSLWCKQFHIWKYYLKVSTSSSCCTVAHGQDMYTERVTHFQMFSRPEGRVAFIGTVLALLQSVGFILSLYLLVSNYSGDGEDDPQSHVCVEAVLCLMFRCIYENDEA